MERPSVSFFVFFLTFIFVFVFLLSLSVIFLFHPRLFDDSRVLSYHELIVSSYLQKLEVNVDLEVAVKVLSEENGMAVGLKGRESGWVIQHWCRRVSVTDIVMMRDGSVAKDG